MSDKKWSSIFHYLPSAMQIDDIIEQCRGFLTDSEQDHLSYSYQKCKTGIFSSVFVVSFKHSSEGAQNRRFVFKTRISNESSEAETQIVSLKFQKYLSGYDLAPKILHYESSSGFEIQEFSGSPLQVGLFDWKQVARFLANIHIKLQNFDDLQNLPEKWICMQYQQERVKKNLSYIQKTIETSFDAPESFLWINSELKLHGAVHKVCHNDFYPNNILVDERKSNYKIIDFDMISMHWWGYDLASFLYTQCREDIGGGNVRLTLLKLPGRRKRENFIREYIEASKVQNSDPIYSDAQFVAIVDVLVCYGWLFSAVTRFEAYMLCKNEAMVEEIKTRLKFFRILRAKLILERELIGLYLVKVNHQFKTASEQ